MLSKSIVAMTMLAGFSAAQSVHGSGALGTGKHIRFRIRLVESRYDYELLPLCILYIESELI